MALGFTSYNAGFSPAFPEQEVCLGNDGYVWTADQAGNVWYVTPSGTIVTGTYSAGFYSYETVGICQGSDGYIYVTAAGGGSTYISKIFKIDPSTLSVVYSATIDTTNAVTTCVSGPDGNVWIAYANVGGLMRYNVTTTAVTYFANSTSAGFDQIWNDGTYLWGSAGGSSSGGRLARCDMSGTFTSYTFGSGVINTASAITQDASGELWIGGNSLWQVSKSGVLLNTIALPSGAQPLCGILGPDGLPWFGDITNDNLYQVDTSTMTVTTYTFRPSGSSPPNTGGSSENAFWGVVGSDGNMWWSAFIDSTIVRVTGASAPSIQQNMVRIL